MLRWRRQFAVPMEAGKSLTYEQWFEIIAKHRSKMNPPLPPPEPLLTRPTLFDELYGIYNAFWELDASRRYENGPLPIYYDVVTDWLDEHNIFDDAREIIRQLLASMDYDHLLQHVEKEQKAREEQEKGQAKNKRKRRLR